MRDILLEMWVHGSNNYASSICQARSIYIVWGIIEYLETIIVKLHLFYVGVSFLEFVGMLDWIYISWSWSRVRGSIRVYPVWPKPPWSVASLLVSAGRIRINFWGMVGRLISPLKTVGQCTWVLKVTVLETAAIPGTTSISREWPTFNTQIVIITGSCHFIWIGPTRKRKRMWTLEKPQCWYASRVHFWNVGIWLTRVSIRKGRCPWKCLCPSKSANHGRGRGRWSWPKPWLHFTE